MGIDEARADRRAGIEAEFLRSLWGQACAECLPGRNDLGADARKRLVCQIAKPV